MNTLGTTSLPLPRNDTAAAGPSERIAARRSGLWLWAMCLTLFGYAVLGKGWAYLGYPPVFIGELLLVGGLAAASVGNWRAWPQPTIALLLLMLMAWGAIRTMPYVSTYGVDAIRDAVIWGYAIFAFITFWYILTRNGRLEIIIDRYAVFANLFLVAMPLVWAVRYALRDAMPMWPWANVGIIEPKAGDVMVHLAGILAFWIAGLQKRIGLVRLLVLAACAGVIGSYERAGMLAFLAAFLLCAMFRPHHGYLHKLAAVVVIGLVVLAITNVRLKAPSPGETKEREISFQQLIDNLASVTGSSQLGDLDDTKEWRLQWWREISDYTFQGNYFWQGKGFGINLADDDGFQVWKDGSLRSPHNANLVFLARAGVPGLVLWLAVQCAWAGTIFRAYLGAKRSNRQRWAGLFLFLLAYWLAFMVNASFDVFLEGPMGGIWFWCVFGLGLAALWIYRREPGILHDDANPACA